MKLEILKSIITDLHLAGIHDIPANSFMDVEKIESQELVNAVFNQSATTEIQAVFNNEAFDESGIANEMAELFAAFGSGKVPDITPIETIAASQPKVKTKPQAAKPTIIDPRQAKNKPGTQSTADFAFSEKAKSVAKVVDFKPEDYIKTKIEEDSKFILLLPYKDEQQLKQKADFVLLENILKAVDTTYEQTSVVFIDESHKNITQHDVNSIENLAKLLQETLKSYKQKIILSFGQDTLSLTNKEFPTIRQASNKVLDVFEDKKLLANYSLSAMVNTPKYKSTTWTNLLLIKRI